MSPSETAHGAREQWASRTGFMLATIGGAVGLGNIWRFSYVAGENGGAAFLLVYVVFVALIGVPLVIAELSIGRHARADAVAAFGSAQGSERWRLVGWLGVLAATLMLSYYAVIAGWALKYFAGAATGGLWRVTGAEFGGYFRRVISDLGQPVAWQAATLLIAMFIVVGGVQAGIERVNRLLVPFLAIIIVVLAGYALSLPGSAAGVRFLFAPDWTALGEPKVYAAALGQAFFSLGLGVAFFVTYGSYMPRTFPLSASAGVIAVGDTLFAIVAGLAIFPAVFALQGNAAAGPELAFITLPRVFVEMPAGTIVGIVFFGLLAMAAVTSMVALLEIPVASLVHRLGWPRWRATAVMGAFVFVIGLPSAMSYGTLAELRIGSRAILDAIDQGVSVFLLPAVGIGTALFAGWRLDKALVLAQADLGASRLGIVWLWLVRLVVPVMTLAILLQSVGAL
ncbi:MAG: sodium-dependent transporter [Alphaproteobacteria bacterium]|nr:sodium-dependent transporter [Alphaproteobacteria bacterium]MCW5743882.1 sodium-dependent transporter [Alphaproteobacteria bacterium]